ncbi:hypothetical protein TSAR_012688 [Trichomalopsis sarcophagae]|uniref:Uncharacterized protein n=1 Tax=Trichomalopsis sarcophagae TaxID=543379 RepID=A0A232FL79_9HYME|nr:hypothetical protein TSAR_012688 [Trichomalopsis sarcophagae]
MKVFVVCERGVFLGVAETDARRLLDHCIKDGLGGIFESKKILTEYDSISAAEPSNSHSITPAYAAVSIYELFRRGERERERKKNQRKFRSSPLVEHQLSFNSLASLLRARTHHFHSINKS